MPETQGKTETMRTGPRIQKMAMLPFRPGLMRFQISRVLRFGVVIAIAYISSSTLSRAEDDQKICEQYLPAISRSEGVPLGVLYAVGLTETGKMGRLHPYALNIEGTTVFTKDRREALAAFRKARDKGKKLIDLGCMQINHYYHGSYFASVSEMLEPEKNIVYAAKFLKSLKQSEGSWTAAVARYHASPRVPKEQKRYVCMVAANLVMTGFGSWTPQSKFLCENND